MPVIPEPHDHLKAALDAIDEHLAHHETRIAHHQGEIDALHELRDRYRDVLGQVAPDEPPTTVGPITVFSPAAQASPEVVAQYTKAFTGEP